MSKLEKLQKDYKKAKGSEKKLILMRIKALHYEINEKLKKLKGGT